MSAIKRVLPLIFLASLLAVVASCVDSRSPVSDEKTSKIDERLIGDWKVDDNEVWKVTKSKDAENALALKMPDPNAPDPMLAFTTTIKSKSYLSVLSSEIKEDEKPKEIRYAIYQYEFSDKDTVLLRVMDPKAILKAIREKQLVGKIDKDDEEETPEITDTTEGIARYLEAHADQCYPQEPDDAMTFKRQK